MFKDKFVVAGGRMKCINDVLEWTELTSWVYDLLNPESILFELKNELTADYIELKIRLSDWTLKSMPLDEDNSTEIRKADMYSFDWTWITAMEFVRTWVADWDISLSVTIINSK